MARQALVILLFLLAGCTTLQANNAKLQANFTYVEQAADLPIEWDGQGPFFGDCDDFAFAAKNRFGCELWVVQTQSGELHMVCRDGDFVYDNRYRYGSKYPGFYKWIWKVTP